jgi:hypothetical protein
MGGRIECDWDGGVHGVLLDWEDGISDWRKRRGRLFLGDTRISNKFKSKHFTNSLFPIGLIHV